MRLGGYDTPGYANSVRVVVNLAYVADIQSLQIIDVRNPVSPSLLGSYANAEIEGSIYQDVQVVGNLAYLVSDPGKLRIIDVSNPAQPALQDIFDTHGAAIGIDVVGNLAFVADLYVGLQIVNLWRPEPLKLRVNLANGALTLHLTGGLPQNHYVFEYADSLAAGTDWNILASRQVPDDGSTVTVVDDSPVPGLQRFYRARFGRPPEIQPSCSWQKLY